MKLDFPSTMPRSEQLIRSGERRRVGRKHDKRIGPGKVKPKQCDPKTRAAWRTYKAQFGEYMRGLRDMPTRPDSTGGA